MTRNPIDVTDTDGNGYKRYLSDYPETISADIGSLYKEPKAPTLWRDMTPEEKGALLLAHHEGKEIEYHSFGVGWVTERPNWFEWCRYRIKPQPKVEVVEIYGRLGVGVNRTSTPTASRSTPLTASQTPQALRWRKSK